MAVSQFVSDPSDETKCLVVLLLILEPTLIVIISVSGDVEYSVGLTE